MRALHWLPLVCGVVLAEDTPEVDPFVTRLQVFDTATRDLTRPGARGSVNPAIDGLVESKDVRAVAPLAALVPRSEAVEKEVLSMLRKQQRIGLEAHERIEVLERELELLRLKERAGDTTVGPEIQRRLDEKKEKERFFEERRSRSEHLARVLVFLREVRDRAADGCATILRECDADQVGAGFTRLREVFDVAATSQGLFLVRILRQSARPEAEAHVLDVLAHPKADPAVIRAATFALSGGLTRRGAETLLGLWERNPSSMGERVSHVLGLVARERLETIEEARAWVASLEK